MVGKTTTSAEDHWSKEKLNCVHRAQCGKTACIGKKKKKWKFKLQLSEIGTYLPHLNFTTSEIIEEYNFFVIINNITLSYVEGWGMQKKKKSNNWQEWLYE